MTRRCLCHERGRDNVERQRGAIPLPSVAWLARRDDVPRRVGATLGNRDDVLNTETLGFDAAVGTPIPVGRLDSLPLRSREVIHGSVGEASQPSLLVQRALFWMGSVVFPRLCSLLFEPLRILATTAMRLLVVDLVGVGMLLVVGRLPLQDLRFVSLVAGFLLRHDARLAVRSKAIRRRLMREEVIDRLLEPALATGLHETGFASTLNDSRVVSVVHPLNNSAMAFLATRHQTIFGLGVREEQRRGLGFSAFAASLHAGSIPQIVAG